jgi:regulator of protease activity HflC (stomatin/prohibitin superfamily)
VKYKTKYKKQKTMTIKGIILSVIGIGVLLAIVILGFGSWGTVDVGNVGVVLKWGATTGEIKPAGFYTKLPLIEEVIPMNVQVIKEQDTNDCSSSDLQTVTSAISLNIALDPSAAANIYKNVGDDYIDTIVAPAMQESVKATMAKFSAEQLITQREAVREGISALLATKLSVYGINTKAVNIVDFHFSDIFENAIEAKVTAEQNALAAKNKLEQIQFEAQQRIAQADGEAKAIAIQAAAVQAAGGEEYIEMQAVKQWNGVLPQFIGGQSPIPFIGTALHTAAGQEGQPFHGPDPR